MTDRSSDTQVHRQFLDRWSPRAFDGSKLSTADREALFEAVRWAPSAYNAQPWRLLYAEKGDANWDRFLGLLVPANQAWAANTSLLVFFVSDTNLNGNPSHTHSFDTGAAWMSLALQAEKLGLRAHGMSGVDFDAARKELGVPDNFKIDAAAAVGRQAGPEVLPEKYREREKPSDRKPRDQVAFAGNFAA
ncbi:MULTISPECIES: nitroreductase family protein [unclassified Sphingomonas]|uniref:nitroreductase family protein n=1 Tax=unclassified Sphingomonas TaxID=196159 RepID=UPI00070161E8|nr:MULTISPECIES: nitroreductase family protein [unclassified Sphingomonas]KQX19232.1 nitroreductase [Sphingomonas sp. Root1294]KQY65434.1 nitroreductase [Sphingomonas sp. Root50]KRB95268.1 nitroreductase [Sphingomonas sp. Root720]